MVEFFLRTWVKFDLNNQCEIYIKEALIFMRCQMRKLNKLAVISDSTTDDSNDFLMRIQIIFNM